MKQYIKLILLLLIPLLLIMCYSIWDKDLWLEKADFSEIENTISSLKATDDDTTAALPLTADTTAAVVAETVKEVQLDTASQRILFFGDSMLEGLGRRLCDYSMQNGHTLTSVIWYSSTSRHWAETDTLQHFINKVQPTFIVVCLCSNELFVRDLNDRDTYIKQIVRKIGDTPFVWISPPNWKEDTGINELIISNVGTNRYFDSRHLELKRGRDKVHPTFDAAEGWMDTVAVWMNSPQTAHPIRMDKPAEKRKRKFTQIILSPTEL